LNSNNQFTAEGAEDFKQETLRIDAPDWWAKIDGKDFDFSALLRSLRGSNVVYRLNSSKRIFP
jgi:hypothetical protein